MNQKEYDAAYYKEHKEKKKTQQQKWYEANKERAKETARKYRAEHKEEITASRRKKQANTNKAQNDKRTARKLELVEMHGGVCADCEGEFNPVCFDFDHREPEQKTTEISSILMLKWETVLEEIEKCDLVCANCHRLRSKKRYGE